MGRPCWGPPQPPPHAQKLQLPSICSGLACLMTVTECAFVRVLCVHVRPLRVCVRVLAGVQAFVCTNLAMCVCVSVFVSLYVHVWLCMCVSVSVFAWVCFCSYVCVCVCVCVRGWVGRQACRHRQIHRNANVHYKFASLPFSHVYCAI